MEVSKIINPITEESINTVPCSRIFEDQELNIIIQKHCKEVLRMSKNRRDGHAFDEVGRLVNIKNHADKLDIYGAWDERLKNCVIRTCTFEYSEMVVGHDKHSLVFVHNHPNNSSLSINDILQLLLDQSIVGVIAVGNTKGTYFLTKQSSNYNYSKLYKGITDKLRNCKENKKTILIDKIKEEILNNAEKYSLYYGKSGGR